MNKFETILDSVRYFSKLLGHMGYAVLEVSKTAEETKEDFIASKRTHECAVAVQLGRHRVSSHYTREDVEKNICYSITANNKINFLLENPERISTFPKTDEERVRFECMNIYGGGIRVTEPKGLLIAVSGFHPRIDEACSIVCYVSMLGLNQAAKEYQLKQCCTYFNNPYALAIAAGHNFLTTMTFDQAIEWGKNEIK